jgi:hypothetical protein
MSQADTKDSEPVTSQPQVCLLQFISGAGILLNHLRVFCSPKATDQMIVNAGGNKNALNREIGTDGMRGWSYGLFDCFNECGLCTLRRTGTTNSSHTDACLPRRLLGHVVPLRRL